MPSRKSRTSTCGPEAAPLQHPSSQRNLEAVVIPPSLSQRNPQAMPAGVLAPFDREIFYNFLECLYWKTAGHLSLLIVTTGHPPQYCACLVDRRFGSIVLTGPKLLYNINKGQETARKEAVMALYDQLICWNNLTKTFVQFPSELRPLSARKLEVQPSGVETSQRVPICS